MARSFGGETSSSGGRVFSGICALAVAASLSGLATLAISCAPTFAQGAVTYLDQGWTDAEKQWWYTASQGSRLVPLSWLTALEQRDSTDKFLSDANVRKLGYLPDGTTGSALPLGFVVDQGPAPDGSQKPWVGMTCAACHTGEFTYGQHRVRLDGAPTLADFQSLMEELLASLAATRADPQKLDRFVSAVLGTSPSAPDRATLIADLDRQIVWFTRLAAKNAAPIRYGHGRLDAQGHILNKIALSVGAAEPLIHFPSDAPASYPFLWTTPQHAPAVQWNGIAPQPLGDQIFNGKTFDFGAMLRNTTELIGVFGSLDVNIVPGKDGYDSSLRFENMIDLENLVKRLKSPRWPQQLLPPIDANRANEGRALYAKHKCNDCHTVLDPATELETKFTITMTGLKDIGTDIWLACNAYLHESKSGLLEGRPGLFDTIADVGLTFNLLINMSSNMIARARQTPSSEPAMNAHRNLRRGGLVATAAAPAVAGAPEYDDPVKAQRAQRCRTDTDPILAYKARPLNGIWATAPYLHNGSVPTLYELLLPPNQRKTTFWVGGTQFDPNDVGFKSNPGDGPFEFRVRDANGKIIPGNDNGGHDYGAASMTNEERRALVEYLKTL
ncbi:hypothetical protein KIP88_19570 [Bradyrhizobium sp. SRL28]|uniref:di-heme-cytochrome C peroxidase n=1 Tax=Bradyrhizobium sp. SRL28 TaxID=2836178 RepID=UPI001BDE87FC|nr:di-heme-cytochrome C peroxidase [Bradyrhizobium sp. SRL28]MBT1512704.1 hypothetical protein [Bradyrhizobium sp. SRL28]